MVAFMGLNYFIKCVSMGGWHGQYGDLNAYGLSYCYGSLVLLQIKTNFDYQNMPDKLTTTEIEQRTPVWFALSRLWAGQDLQDNDLEKMAQTMVDSGYSLSELRVICDSEIAPVLLKKGISKQWASFDEAWLAQQIMNELNKPKRWQDALLDPLRRPFVGLAVESEWPILIMKYQRIQRMKTRIEL